MTLYCRPLRTGSIKSTNMTGETEVRSVKRKPREELLSLPYHGIPLDPPQTGTLSRISVTKCQLALMV